MVAAADRRHPQALVARGPGHARLARDDLLGDLLVTARRTARATHRLYSPDGGHPQVEGLARVQVDQHHAGQTRVHGVRRIHALKYRKYGKTCLAAFAYQLNRRFQLRGLVATLIADVARSKPVPEKVVSWGHAEACL